MFLIISEIYLFLFRTHVKQFIDRQKTGKGATLPVFILLTNPVDWIERITLIFAIRKENCDAEGLQR